MHHSLLHAAAVTFLTTAVTGQAGGMEYGHIAMAAVLLDQAEENVLLNVGLVRPAVLDTQVQQDAAVLAPISAVSLIKYAASLLVRAGAAAEAKNLDPVLLDRYL